MAAKKKNEDEAPEAAPGVPYIGPATRVTFNDGSQIDVPGGYTGESGSYTQFGSVSFRTEAITAFAAVSVAPAAAEEDDDD